MKNLKVLLLLLIFSSLLFGQTTNPSGQVYTLGSSLIAPNGVLNIAPGGITGSMLTNAGVLFLTGGTLTGGIIAPSFTVPNDGVHPSIQSWIGNPTLPAWSPNSVNILGPSTSTFTAYALQLPSVPPTAGQTVIFGTPIITANGPAVPITYGSAGISTVYNTQSTVSTGNIPNVSMVSNTSALHDYLFSWSISLTTPGTACTGNTTVTLNAIFTDPNSSTATTMPIGTVTLASGVGTVGFIASGTNNILAKSGTAVQYSTSNYTLGTGCTGTNPSYQLTPVLMQEF